VLGVDLGTTFTAAASWRDGHAEIITLGTRSAAIPSVVLFRDDGSTMTGDAAELRAVTEPERIAREFKRRIGDSTPLLVGGAPRSPESIMAVLLRDAVGRAVEREGSQPDRIAVTHPASWGQFKLDVLRQAVRLAELGTEPELVPEPVAAAVHYATLQRVELHDFVAVYDLGGGTFDAAVVRRTDDGFTIYGQPEGIERLGGIDVDAAVFGHVQSSLGLQLDTLDRDDPAVVSAFARLRADCVAAKEALSSDTDAVIPVILPGLSTEVRITRSELESMIRPAITDTIAATRRAIASGGLVPEHMARILLVGGSSRIPLVGEMVNAELGRPIALDTHPKHAVALGAATSVAPKAQPAPFPSFVPPPTPTPVPSAPTTTPMPPLTAPPAAAPPSTPPPSTPPPSTPAAPKPAGDKRPVLIGAAVAVVLLIAAIAFAASQSGGKSAASTRSSPISDSIDSSDPFSSDSFDSFDSFSLTEDDAKTAAENLVFTLFGFDADNIDELQSELLKITTGSLSNQISEDNSSFVESVKSNDTIAFADIHDTTVRSFDGSTAVVLVNFTATIEDFSGSSASSDREQSFLIILISGGDGTFLASELVDCSEGSGGSATDFSDLGSDASC
jgi:actin-like ATPase involved in cell morphogenesis